MENRKARTYMRALLATRGELVKHTNPWVGAERAVFEPADWAERASTSLEVEVASRLRQTNATLLRAIDQALERIKRGTFGFCAGCHRPIGRLRLEAVPWTSLCLDCKEERGQAAPMELHAALE